MSKEKRQQQLPQATRQRQHTETLAKALKRERDALEVIMENTGAHLAYLDPDFNFARVNSAYAKGSGYTIDELIGRNHFDLFPNKENQAIFEMVRNTGNSVEFHDKPFEYKDQPWRGITYWDWTLVPVKDTSGHVQGLVLSLVDATKRKRLEHNLRERIKELLCLCSIANLAQRPGITVAKICEEIVNILPQSWHDPEITCAKIAIDGKAFRTSNYRESKWKQSAAIKVHGAKAGEVEVNYLEERPEVDEGPFLKEERVLINAVAEQLGGIIERKQAEEKLKESENKLNSILSSMVDLVFVFDKKGRFTFYRSSTGELYMPPKTFLGKKHSEVMPPHVNKLTTTAFNKNKKGEVAEYEYWLEIGGETKWYSAKLSPMFSDGEFVGSVAVVRDVTEHKKLDQLKDEFIGLVSHELRSPLTVITGAVNTVLAEGARLSPEETRQLLEDAALEAESLSHLLGNLLELSRVQADRLVLYAEEISVKKVTQDVVDEIRQQSSAHQFIVDIPKKLPPVYADQLRLERILYNLLENAVKYSPQGGEIRVSVKPEEEHLVIGVSDQGIGISPSDQAKLFGPFRRLEESKLNGVGGTGLGLLVCRRLAEAHGGRIWIESEPGQGSTFFFTLPLVHS
jgi:PAS domain S-box-containing protein